VWLPINCDPSGFDLFWFHVISADLSRSITKGLTEVMYRVNNEDWLLRYEVLYVDPCFGRSFCRFKHRSTKCGVWRKMPLMIYAMCGC